MTTDTRLEAKLEAMEAEMETAINAQRETTEADLQKTEELIQQSEAWAEAVRREIAFNKARYGQGAG